MIDLPLESAYKHLIKKTDLSAPNNSLVAHQRPLHVSVYKALQLLEGIIVEKGDNLS